MQASHAGEVRVLGPVEVLREDGSVAALKQKERQLLAALAIDAGRTLSSDRLVDALWDGSPPRSTPKLLQVYVSKLRKLLPPSVRIATHGSGYALELEEGALDAVRFERVVAEGRDATAAGNAALASSLLARALALWRGPAYAEVADEEFARAEAGRLEELRLVALEERVDAELALGRHAETLPEIVMLADANPLRERLQGQAMLALYRAGRQTEALERYATTRRRLHDELGLEPSDALRELQRQILRHDPELSCSPPRRSLDVLPAPPNPLLGRERELAEISDLLRRDDVRLLVLTGAGGSGKTRLALEAARRCAGEFADGATLVELAPVRDPNLIPSAIANALGLDVVGRAPVDDVVAEVAPRELLLVLDNFEHVRDGAPFLTELLARVPRLTILVTSRVVLHLSGEHVYPVEPLCPHDAVELFLERARTADARFRTDAGSEGAIEAICRRLDGLPLAIELAAGHVRVLTPRELLDGLEQRLPLLVGGPRDLPARQRTLRSTLEWSFDLLTEDERRDLARLSVFAGGCTLESATAVCGATLEQLSSLVDQNLLVRTVASAGSRYTLLETVREFALRQLEETGEAGVIRRRHAERMLAIARSAHLSEDDDEPFEQAVALAERDDLRAALDWTVEHDPEFGLELAVALENLWSAHTPGEGARRLQQLLARAEDVTPRLRARALRVLAGSAHQELDFAVADPAYEESLRLFREIRDLRGIASITTRLAYRAFTRGDVESVRRLIAESQALASGRFVLIEAQNLLLLGHDARTSGRFDEAEVLLRRCREVGAPLRWAWWEANIEYVLADVCLRRGDLDQAERHARAAVAINLEQEHPVTVVQALAGVARIALARGDRERAGLIWGAVADRGEGRWGVISRPWVDEICSETDPVFTDATARGRDLELHEAAAIVLGDADAETHEFASTAGAR